MTFKERCEKLATDYEALDDSCVGDVVYEDDGSADYHPYKIQKFELGRIALLESFAREIHNEALEEAAKESIRYAWKEGVGCAEAIRTLALAARGSENG